MTEGSMQGNSERPLDAKWFALTGLFRHMFPHDARVPKYECRTTLCVAKDRESAERTLLEECRSYAGNDVEFLEEYEVFELDGSPGPKPVEVAHEMVVSTAEPEAFIKMHWSRERVDSCEAHGWTHVWYNQDDTHSACYNCRQVRRGRLWEKADDHQSRET